VRLAGRKAVVTGAGGFIGGRIARRLAEEGARVKALVRQPLQDVADDCAGISQVRGDVDSPECMRAVADGADYVVHAAMTTRPARHSTMWRTAVEGARNVYEAAQIAGADRFVFISSFSVYIGLGGIPYDERSPLIPSGDAYGDAKIRAEELLSAPSAGGPKVFILRPPIVFGPGSRFWSTRYFEVARRRPLLLPAGGHFSVAYIYISNLVDAVCDALLTSGQPGAYNVFDGVLAYREFVEPYARPFGRSGVATPLWLLQAGACVTGITQAAVGIWSPISLPMLNFLTGGRSAMCRPPEKARLGLNWQTRVPFDQAISETLQDLQECTTTL
jgi:nucleoside-diphosphate-sugar epimerase